MTEMTAEKRRMLEIEAAKLVLALIETAKEAGAVGMPLGPAYMAYMSKGYSLEMFNRFVDIAKATGKVKVSNHCMYFVE